MKAEIDNEILFKIHPHFTGFNVGKLLFMEIVYNKFS